MLRDQRQDAIHIRCIVDAMGRDPVGHGDIGERGAAVAFLGRLVTSIEIHILEILDHAQHRVVHDDDGHIQSKTIQRIQFLNVDLQAAIAADHDSLVPRLEGDPQCRREREPHRTHAAAVMHGLLGRQAQALCRPHLVIADIANVIDGMLGQNVIQFFEKLAGADLPVRIFIELRPVALY